MAVYKSNIYTKPPSPPPGTGVNISVGKEDVVISKMFYYSNTTSPNLGLSVILYRQSTMQVGVLIEIARLVTGENGLAQFTVSLTDMITGDYELRTYGSYTVPRYYPLGDWEKFHFTNPNDTGGTGIPDLVFSSLPTFNVTETGESAEIVVDSSRAETTTAVFSLTNISITEGRIASVVIEYRKYGIGLATFTHLATFGVDGDAEITSLTFKAKIALYAKPTSYYDFKCYIQGVNGEWAVYDGNKIELTDTNVSFDGVTDLPEYIEVEDLVVTNANDPEGGVLPGIYAELSWTDIRTVNSGMFPKGLLNPANPLVPYNVTYNQAQRIFGYGVFMYVTESGIPPTNEYPVSGISDTGTWYFMGEFEKAYAKIRCPYGDYVGFWVGMRSPNTATSLVKNYIKI